MALAFTRLHASGYEIVYAAAEDNQAVAIDQQDVLADLVALGIGTDTPIYLALDDAFANQAAARTRVDTYFDLSCTPRVLSVGTTQLFIDQDIVGGVVAGNFRLTGQCVKAANADTGTWIVRMAYRHSIVW